MTHANYDDRAFALIADRSDGADPIVPEAPTAPTRRDHGALPEDATCGDRSEPEQNLGDPRTRRPKARRGRQGSHSRPARGSGGAVIEEACQSTGKFESRLY
jgi:hypothetical protein